MRYVVDIWRHKDGYKNIKILLDTIRHHGKYNKEYFASY